MDPGPKDVLITSPTWPNHRLLYESMGFQVRGLPYYKNRAFDFDGYMAALRAARPGSIVILHGCAHNPTGCDPSKEEWKGIGKVIQAKKIFPIFDAAYLGFTSGNVDEDAWSIRYFVNDLGLEAAVCLSFSKNMGLYGTLPSVEFMTSSKPKDLLFRGKSWPCSIHHQNTSRCPKREFSTRTRPACNCYLPTVLRG